MSTGSLTPKQIELLDWVKDGCPDGVYEGTRYRTSARALAAQGLLKVKGHGPGWTATITDAGRDWKPAKPSPRQAKNPTTKAALKNAPATVVHPVTPLPPSDREQANELITRVIAAGGHLPVPDGRGDYERHERLVRLSLSSPDRPHGKKLAIVPVGSGWNRPSEIVFTDHFDDLVEMQPVPVLDHVGKYSPAVRAYLADKDWQYVSAEHVSRAARLLEAIVREAPSRGLKVLPSRHGNVKSHVAFEVDSSVYTVQIREISAPGGEPVRPVYYGNRRKGPAWMHQRQRAFISTGQLELVVDGRLAGYDGDHYRDTKTATVEEKLPRLFQRLEVYRLQAAAAAEEKRRCDEERRRLWEAAMAKAKVKYDEHIRWEHFKRYSDEWREIGRHREFLVAARLAAADYDGEDKGAILAQLDMAERRLDETDSVRNLKQLVPVVKEPKNDDLKPFLGGWSPEGPKGY